MSVNAFIDYLRVVKRRSDRTLRQYRSILREFQKFEPATKSSFLRYLNHISSNAPKTQALKLLVVKSYLDWKADQGLIKGERFWQSAEPPRSKTLPRYLDESEVQALIRATDDPYYRAVFKFLLSTGLRISELLSLKKSDISIMGETARIRIKGKGSKERIIAAPADVVKEAIEAGVLSRKVSARTIQRALRRYAEKAGIKKRVTPHILRHTFAVLLIEKGVPVNKIQLLLGHESLATTGIYLKIAGESVLVPKVV